MPKRDENGGFWFTTETGSHVYCQPGQSKEEAIQSRFGDKDKAHPFSKHLRDKLFEPRGGMERTGKQRFNEELSNMMDEIEDFDEREQFFQEHKDEIFQDIYKYGKDEGTADELWEKHGRSIYDVVNEYEEVKDYYTKKKDTFSTTLADIAFKEFKQGVHGTHGGFVDSHVVQASKEYHQLEWGAGEIGSMYRHMEYDKKINKK